MQSLNVVPAGNSDMLIKLDEGECLGAVAIRDAWNVNSRLKKYNEACNKYKVGDTIYPASAGWATKTDSGIL